MKYKLATKTDKSINTWLVASFARNTRQIQTEYSNIGYRPHVYRYDRNALQNVQTLMKVSVWKKATKLGFQGVENNKYFTRALLACDQLFSSTISPRNCDLLFGTFMTNSVATIRQRVKTICLSLETESKACLSKLRKYIKNSSLRQARKNKESETKWHWTPQHVTLMKLLKPAFVQQMCRIGYLLIRMLLLFQGVIYRAYLWLFLSLVQKLP